MNPLCLIDQLISWIFHVYTGVLIVYAIVSWIPDLRGAWTRYLAMLVEPLLSPIRRIVPSLGGLDLAFIVLFVLVAYVVPAIIGAAMGGACYASY